MSIAFVTWKDFYSVGCREMDNQHKQILGIINDLYLALENEREQEEMRGLLVRLVQYTKDHFQCEEHLMKERGYPEMAQHKTTHEHMTQKTIDLREHFGAVSGQDLLVFLKEWWINHICRTDKQYRAYMKPMRTA